MERFHHQSGILSNRLQTITPKFGQMIFHFCRREDWRDSSSLLERADPQLAVAPGIIIVINPEVFNSNAGRQGFIHFILLDSWLHNILTGVVNCSPLDAVYTQSYLTRNYNVHY